jgi:hypothetical protein
MTSTSTFRWATRAGSVLALVTLLGATASKNQLWSQRSPKVDGTPETNDAFGTL